MLTLGAEAPGRGNNSDDCSADDGRVGFPVRRLSVPASCGRPDFLGIPSEMTLLALRPGHGIIEKQKLTGFCRHHPFWLHRGTGSGKGGYGEKI